MHVDLRVIGTKVYLALNLALKINAQFQHSVSKQRILALDLTWNEPLAFKTLVSMVLLEEPLAQPSLGGF